MQYFIDYMCYFPLQQQAQFPPVYKCIGQYIKNNYLLVTVKSFKLIVLVVLFQMLCCWQRYLYSWRFHRRDLSNNNSMTLIIYFYYARGWKQSLFFNKLSQRYFILKCTYYDWTIASEERMDMIITIYNYKRKFNVLLIELCTYRWVNELLPFAWAPLAPQSK